MTIRKVSEESKARDKIHRMRAYNKKMGRPLPALPPVGMAAKMLPPQPAHKKAKNYLNNADMLAQVKLSLKKGKMTDDFAKMLMLLVQKYATKSNWANYTYNDDMQSHALVQLCKSWAGFNPAKYSNPFAYYTQFIKNSFVQFLNKEKDERTKRDALLVDGGYNPSHNYILENSNMTPSDERIYVPDAIPDDVDRIKHLL